MSWKKTLILGLIFLCASAGYFLDRSLTQKRLLTREREEALFTMVKEDVTAFTLTNQNGSFRLEKRDDAWWIVAPRDLKADADQAESLLANLEAAKRYDPVETKDLEQYGLSDPRVTIILESAKTGDSQTLYVGLESAVSGRCFATTKGDKAVFTVAAHIRNFLDKNLFHLRDKTVFDIKGSDIVNIAIERRGETIVLEKSAVEEWVLSSPVKDKADIAFARNLLSDIETLRATSYEDDKPTSPGIFGLDDPLIHLTVGCRDDSLSLVIGKEQPASSGRYAQKGDSDQIFTLSNRFVDDLRKDAGAFRAKDVFRVSQGDIREIKLIVGESVVSIVRDDDDKWTFQTSPHIPVHQGRVHDLLRDIKALQIRSFEEESPATLEPYGLSSPLARVIVYPEDREQKEILSFGNKAEDRDVCFARLSHRPLIFGLDWTKVCNFYLTRQDMEDRRLLAFSAQDVYGVEIREAAQKRYLEKKGERWFLRAEAEVKAAEIPSYEALGFLGIIGNLEFDTRLDEEKINVIEVLDTERMLEAVIRDKEGKILESFEVMGKDSDVVLTLKTSRGERFLIAKNKVEKFRSDLDALFEKK